MNTVVLTQCVKTVSTDRENTWKDLVGSSESTLTLPVLSYRGYWRGHDGCRIDFSVRSGTYTWFQETKNPQEVYLLILLITWQLLFIFDDTSSLDNYRSESIRQPMKGPRDDGTALQACVEMCFFFESLNSKLTQSASEQHCCVYAWFHSVKIQIWCQICYCWHTGSDIHQCTWVNDKKGETWLTESSDDRKLQLHTFLLVFLLRTWYLNWI